MIPTEFNFVIDFRSPAHDTAPVAMQFCKVVQMPYKVVAGEAIYFACGVDEKAYDFTVDSVSFHINKAQLLVFLTNIEEYSDAHTQSIVCEDLKQAGWKSID